MRHAKRSSRRRIRGEEGYVLILTALLIVPLLVFTGFGVDLGSWYAQAARQQRAVDAASLAGVVQLPSVANAKTAALASLKANGYVFSSCGSGTSVNATTQCAFAFPSASGQEMTVTLYQSADIYFAGAAGLHSQNLTRSATAVYNLHIPLGSPNNVFGNNLPNGCSSLTSTKSPCPSPNKQPNLFAAINGPFSRYEDGDPYATMCSGDTTTAKTCDTAMASKTTGGSPTYTQPTSSQVQNASYNPNGYIWAVDVKQANVPITVAIFDPANGGTGDPLNETLTSSGGTFNTSYELFNTTGSSADVEETPALSMQGKCASGTPGWANFASGTSKVPQSPGFAGVAPYYTMAWYSLCTFTPTQIGIYPLQVKTSDITNGKTGIADSGTGWNVYSVRATATSGTQPQVYALDSMSIWTASVGTTASFYLANIGKQYAGHTLKIYLYDPGDGSGPDAFTMQFVPPPSGLGVVPTGTGSLANCNYNKTPSPTQVAPATTDVATNCKITTKTASGTGSGGVYNGNWLNVVISIPTTYTCTTDCWWWVKYTLGTGSSTPTDRTVWVVNVLGDPVHLIQ